MMTSRIFLAPAALALSLTATATGATILMDWDPEVNNGAFTGLTSTNFSPWVSLDSGSPSIPTTNPSSGSGGENFAITRDRQLGYDLGYTIADGDIYSISFAWYDAANWDADDTVDMTLFYTDDNTITGARTTLINLNSGGRDGTGTWETESLNDATFSDSGAVGKKLFVVLSATNVTQGEFARMDDIFIEVVPVPEPSSAALTGLLIAAGFLHRRRR